MYQVLNKVKQWGELIGFRKSTHFICQKEIGDPSGRILILIGTLGDQEVNIVSYYAPNSKQLPLLRQLLLPKPITDSLHWANYRPISLVNINSKLSAKMLAERLKKGIEKLIHGDQVSLIPSRQAGDNIRTVALFLHKAKHRVTPLMLLCLHIKKAFDLAS